jgi:3-isopropylmalate/(R)-2-methylmalate dehydratase small subunit
MLAIALPADTLEQLFVLSEQHDDINIQIDLENQTLTSDKFSPISFDIRKDVKERLLSGLDFIGVTETLNPQIDTFEKQLAAERPWQ